MTRCEHRDAVGQRCLRPDGHALTFPGGWFTDGAANHGHDYGGVSTDALSVQEWNAKKSLDFLVDL